MIITKYIIDLIRKSLGIRHKSQIVGDENKKQIES